MANTEKKPAAPNKPKAPRKPAFRMNATQKKLLADALNDYDAKIDAMPAHPLVDNGALKNDLLTLKVGLGVAPAPATDAAPVE